MDLAGKVVIEAFRVGLRWVVPFPNRGWVITSDEFARLVTNPLAWTILYLPRVGSAHGADENDASPIFSRIEE